MRGLDSLIALRQQRVRPAVVSIHLSRYAPNPDGETLELVLFPAEPIPSDLRALVGLDVICAAEDEPRQLERLLSLCQACVEAGAKRVVGIEFKCARGVPTTQVFAHGLCN